jgi:hypothetical protein
MTVLISCIVVVLAVLMLVAFVVHRSTPRRFRISAKVFKLLDITIEVDALEKPNELRKPSGGRA